MTGSKLSNLVLQNNGGDELTISANGDFIFTKPIASGAGYAVAVKTQPTSPTTEVSQTCTVSNGDGDVIIANVNNVEVTCKDDTYTISVTVSGLRKNEDDYQ